jgi:anti-sigma B factor antagonist
MEPGRVELERQDDGLCVVRLLGEHDLNTAARLREQLGVALGERHGVVVDLSGATFIDSSILGAILEARQRSTETGTGFAIAGGGGPPVERVLEITGLKEALPVRPNSQEAIDLARAAPPEAPGPR